MIRELPTGLVTFLFTDVEGSTRLWEQSPAAMREALVRHDTLIESLTEANDGTLVRPRGEGDSRFAVFAQASCAVAAAAAIQQALRSENWPRQARCGCGWPCTPVRPICATGITMDRRSIAAPGCVPWRMVVNRYCRVRPPN